VVLPRRPCSRRLPDGNRLSVGGEHRSGPGEGGPPLAPGRRPDLPSLRPDPPAISSVPLSAVVPPPSPPQAFRLDLALANLGTALSRRVTGRISAEVDVRLAHDADALVARARALARQFAADGLARDRLLLRIPSTLEGAQAIRALQDEGLACHAIFCYSFAQAEAVAGFGGAEVVQYGLSRVRDWHRKYPNVPRRVSLCREGNRAPSWTVFSRIPTTRLPSPHPQLSHTRRDPHGPREDSGYASDVDPAALVLDDIWALCAGRLDGKARVIVSGVRTRKDALSVAGVDYLIAPSNVLEELARTPTREGYNDGMGGLSSDEQGGGVTRALSRPAARARASALPPCPHTGPNGFDSKAFNKTISKAGADLLRESLERHVKHVEDLTRGMAEYATKRG